jgi:hypothetical protein
MLHGTDAFSPKFDVWRLGLSDVVLLAASMASIFAGISRR